MKRRRWALLPRLVKVEDEGDKPVEQAADKQLKEQVTQNQEALLVKLNQLETRTLRRS